MKKHKKSKKKQKKGFKKRFLAFVNKNKVIISLIIIILIILFFSGAKIFLLANFLLGNDLVVKLNVDKEIISLVRGQEENVVFQASVTTNPFCSASCRSTFKDISRGKIIEQDMFTLKPAIKLHKDYTIKATRLGSGVELYRFTMECNSKRTLLCHTGEELTKRNILVTIKYDLNDEDKKIKSDLKEDLEILEEKLSEMYGENKVLYDAVNELNATLIVSESKLNMENIEESLENHFNNIKKTQDIWEKEDYNLLAAEVDKLDKGITKSEKQFMELNKSLLALVHQYNFLIEESIGLKGQLEQLRIFSIVNRTITQDIDDTVKEFNSFVGLFKQKNELDKKKKIVMDMTDRTEELSLSANIIKETLNLQLQLDIAYDSICKVAGLCIQHPSIEERANKELFELNATCTAIDRLKDMVVLLNTSMRDSFIEEKYPDTENFWHNISLNIGNIKQNITRAYLDRLPEKGSNIEIIGELLLRHNFNEIGDYPKYNLTPALISELLKQLPENCHEADLKIEPVKDFNFNKIKINNAVPVPLGIEFEEQKPKCCVFGKCDECCISENCSKDPAKLPIVFLHGHAFNKDVSAEYSLDAFNKIQEKLESDGYLNAGAISLYTPHDTPYGIWGLLPVPLTIKASYYFDVFKEPANYMVVQTKSENVDTYAVRLKELIDTIQYKTGKQKVTIIAHSMGGLVARRYMQIFGEEKVEKLILIAVPNNGIAGNIADYCPLLGEKLECRDMNEDSLFMNKLNREELPDIPIYNIVGTGCSMGQDTGDGTVLEKGVMLKGTKNFIINGTCKRLEKLHTKLLDIDAYPETYYAIKEALKN